MKEVGKNATSKSFIFLCLTNTVNNLFYQSSTTAPSTLRVEEVEESVELSPVVEESGELSTVVEESGELSHVVEESGELGVHSEEEEEEEEAPGATRGGPAPSGPETRPGLAPGSVSAATGQCIYPAQPTVSPPHWPSY